MLQRRKGLKKLYICIYFFVEGFRLKYVMDQIRGKEARNILRKTISSVSNSMRTTNNVYTEETIEVTMVNLEKW